MNDKYSIFVSQGGLGKIVASTAVAEAIKNNHPDRKLIVVTSYPEVYINNPFVHKAFRIGNTSYFYRDYIEGKDSLIFNGDPYYNADHIHKRRHLILNWCNLFKLTYKDEKPLLMFNQLEKDTAFRKYGSSKPICLLQSGGGPLNMEKPYSWTRDLPPNQIQEIIDKLKYRYTILQVTRPNTFKFNDVVVIPEIPKRELLSILLISEKRILIDSCLQHAAAALKLPSTVCWIGTSPVTFGYPLHKNITPVAKMDMNHLTDSFLFDFDFNGHEWEYPYSTNTLFDINQVVA